MSADMRLSRQQLLKQGVVLLENFADPDTGEPASRGCVHRG